MASRGGFPIQDLPLPAVYGRVRRLRDLHQAGTARREGEVKAGRARPPGARAAHELLLGVGMPADQQGAQVLRLDLSLEGEAAACGSAPGGFALGQVVVLAPCSDYGQAVVLAGRAELFRC
jgi:hypothetical protein